MKATVRFLNPARGMVAAITEDGEFSVFEVLGSETFAEGDIVSWQGDTPLGGEKVTNHSQGEVCDVFFENHHVRPDHLRRALLL